MGDVLVPARARPVQPVYHGADAGFPRGGAGPGRGRGDVVGRGVRP